jgi:hypothetical protein
MFVVLEEEVAASHLEADSQALAVEDLLVLVETSLGDLVFFVHFFGSGYVIMVLFMSMANIFASTIELRESFKLKYVDSV